MGTRISVFSKGWNIVYSTMFFCKRNTKEKVGSEVTNLFDS